MFGFNEWVSTTNDRINGWMGFGWTKRKLSKRALDGEALGVLKSSSPCVKCNHTHNLQSVPGCMQIQAIFTWLLSLSEKSRKNFSAALQWWQLESHECTHIFFLLCCPIIEFVVWRNHLVALYTTVGSGEHKKCAHCDGKSDKGGERATNSPSAAADLQWSAVRSAPFPFAALKHSSMLSGCDRLSTIDPWDAAVDGSICMAASHDCIWPGIGRKKRGRRN